MEGKRLGREEFEQELLSRLRQSAGSGDEIRIETVPKNNGQMRRGIVIRMAGSNMSPVFYLDPIYEIYLENLSLDEIVEVIWQYYMTDENIREIDVNDFMDWEWVKERLFLRVVSTDMNLEVLDTVIHKDMLDLSAVVYVRIDCTCGGGAKTAVVRKEHLAFWQQSEDNVYEIARQNTTKDKILCESLIDTLSSMLNEVERKILLSSSSLVIDHPIFVLTNEANLFGAVYMLFPEIMEQIAKEREDDLYILPSSIHEMIVLGASDAMDPFYLKYMVYNVNETQMAPEERLSNHVYKYRRGVGLEIAA